MIDILKILILQITIIIIPTNWVLPFWYWECNTKYDGLYNYNSKTIYICQWEHQKEILIHELWHHFYRTYLTKEERQLYKELCIDWEDSIEDFAYSFSEIYFKKKENKRIEYIKTLIIKYNKNVQISN